MPANTYYLSRLTLLDGTVLEIKDATARAAIAGGTVFRGITTTALTDGASTSIIVINGNNHTAVNGDIVVYGNKEFIYASADSKWHELGDLSNLGALAVKDTASGTYTPTGDVSKPDIDVTESTTAITEFDDEGSVTPGTAASAILPSLATSYDSVTETVTLTWTAGSFTPNVPTSVTLPTTQQTTVVTGVTAELHEAPTFDGDTETITVS